MPVLFLNQRREPSKPQCLGAAPKTLAVLLALVCLPSALRAQSGVVPGIPLCFEADQIDAPTRFLARTPVAQFLIGPTEVTIGLTKVASTPAPPTPLRRGLVPNSRSATTRFARAILAGASSTAVVEGADPMPGKMNYLIGNDPSQWRTGLPLFAHLQVTNIYPGIDLVYYGNQRQLEYDFTVAPGADPSAIHMCFEGVDKVALGADGELVLQVGDGELRQHRPEVYQLSNGARRPITGSYKLLDDHSVSFAIGSYDHRLPLTIDPTFDYSTYFGGNGSDVALAIKVDASGNVYLAGQTLSTGFGFTVPANAFQRSFQGGTINGDAFVAKLNNTGKQLLYFTYLGSPGEDGALDLAIDSAGHAYVTGFTDSSAFPVRNAAFPNIHGTPDINLGLYLNDAFVSELSADGSSLVFSTFFGGIGTDIGVGIAVDPAGYVYITGNSYSSDLPTSTNSFQRFLSGNDDAFVAKFSPGGSNLIYATYLGGTNVDEGEGIAADSEGAAYVTGYTISPDFPVTSNGWQTTFNNNTNGIVSYDAFVTKIGPFGSNLVYSTFLGGTLSDYGYRIALDPQKNAYVTGTTISRDFPVIGSVYGLSSANADTNNSISFEAFLTRFDSSGQATFSTMFGGTDTDAGWDVAVDPAGRAFVIGTTFSTNFPVVSPFGFLTATPHSGTNVFVTAFNTNGLAARYSGYLGGSAANYGYGIAVDSESSAYITGLTYANNFPTTAGAFQTAARSSIDAFIAKLRLLDPLLTVTRSGNNFVVQWPASAPQYVLQAASGLVPPITWTTVAPAVLSGPFYTVTLSPTNNFAFFRLLRQ